ncbi:hypothetical protein PS865_03797 [Pseudomonas fluorescens]|uniref:hypothetical protein n=1 Tax=Pseudomonas fluorescens TaxID=294 RepID=UPI001240C723|nr:hypothetical protein [Pseudomonas fluorescens]VVP19660.1 hypothetical protein PS865_03797 [Pseudomonas fluorescens]
MSNPSSNDKALEQTVNANDDGFAIGTAGRDEDPNATTDWDVSRDHEDVMTPDDTRGLPGYPGAEKNNPSKPVADSSVPANGDPSVQNDGAD